MNYSEWCYTTSTEITPIEAWRAATKQKEMIIADQEIKIAEQARVIEDLAKRLKSAEIALANR